MTTKFYYSYNTQENAFTGKFPAIKNPRRQTEYLLPARATFIEPPETNNEEIAIWDGNNWMIEKDLRGQYQVNIETKEISNIDYIGKVKDGFQNITKEVAEDIEENPDKYKKVESFLVDISNTDEYKEFLKNKEIEKRKIEIERELLELDSKRVRAICEPSIKDETTGETWLDYYNTKVLDLRKELSEL